MLQCVADTLQQTTAHFNTPAWRSTLRTSLGPHTFSQKSKRDLQTSPTKEMHKRDLQKRPMCTPAQRPALRGEPVKEQKDTQKRPIFEKRHSKQTKIHTCTALGTSRHMQQTAADCSRLQQTATDCNRLHSTRHFGAHRILEPHERDEC